MRSPVRARATLLFAAVALLAAACGGSGSTETGAAADGGPDPTPIEDLATNDDVRLLEVLDVETGGATTLADTVTGDRPVLLWFWAPH